MTALPNPAEPIWFMGLKYCDHCGTVAWAPLPEPGIYTSLKCAQCRQEKSWVMAFSKNFQKRPLLDLQRDWELTDPSLRQVEILT